MKDSQFSLNSTSAIPGLVSVVIPCYKQGRYLAEALRSVLAQNYLSKETIVINDGSPDNTRDVAKEFGDKIIYIEQQNGGAARARNTGIGAAHGEYLAFLDADDICLPERLTRQVEILTRCPSVGLVASEAHLINSNGQTIGLKSALSGAPRHPNDFRWETVSYCATTSTVMARRACFETVGGFEDADLIRNAGEDWLEWVKISHDFSMRYLPQPLVGYRVHGTNLTASVDHINRGNRVASHLAVTWGLFPTYPAHFRARLLFYRFATAWHDEPKGKAVNYFLSAVATDITQLPYGLRVVSQGIQNVWDRRRKS